MKKKEEYVSPSEPWRRVCVYSHSSNISVSRSRRYRFNHLHLLTHFFLLFFLLARILRFWLFWGKWSHTGFTLSAFCWLLSLSLTLVSSANFQNSNKNNIYSFLMVTLKGPHTHTEQPVQPYPNATFQILWPDSLRQSPLRHPPGKRKTKNISRASALLRFGLKKKLIFRRKWLTVAAAATSTQATRQH